jgi:type 1 glutamine amidotransferase
MIAKPRPLLWTLFSLVCLLILPLSASQVSANTKPLRALLITGGCCHDYDKQKQILTEGISARANVTWDVVHEGGNSTRHKVSVYENPEWAKGYDVVVHNECFADVRDEAFVENILRPHREGVPAVVIHCAMHSYRIKSDEWFKFVGVTSHRHEGHRPFDVKNLQPEHPVMKDFPASWRTPKGELYEIAALGANTTPLAQAYGQDTKKDHVCVWTSTYGQGRVFGTTIGHHNETMEAEVYLDLAARGLLWAANKLSPEGKPLAGYGPNSKANGDVEEGWISLFDGKTLDGWKASEHKDSFKVQDGTIIVDGPRAHLFYVGPVANANFKDFEFKADVKTFPKGNSGIYFHTKYQETGWPSAGLEAQVNATHSDRRKTGSLYGIKDVMDTAPHKDNEWFNYHIIVSGKRIIFKINGDVVNDYTEPDLASKARRLGSGTFALQAHDPESVIHYKNIRVKLPSEPAGSPVSAPAKAAAPKKVVFVAGNPSHGYAAHEHRAGSLLFAKLIEEANLGIQTVVHTNGWPKDPNAFDGANAIVIYSNGGGGHPVLPHLQAVDQLMKKGVSLLCLHYAVEVPKGDPGNFFLDWIGGYFETHWSVNPHWTLDQTRVASDHPIGRGVKPYAIYDEWYFHMRFLDNMDGVTPILTAIPPENTLNRPDGAHSGNPHVRAKKGEPQHVVWARQRPDGGRGFGFTGGHDHWNWGHPSQRTLVLNAIAWAVGLEVPPNGVPSRKLTLEELEADQDYPQPANFNRDRIRKMLEQWQGSAAE